MLFFSPRLRLRKEMINLKFLVLAFLFLQVYFLVDLIGVDPILSLFWGTGELYFPYSFQVRCDLMTGFSCTVWAEMTCITYGWLYLIAKSPVSYPFAPCLGEHGHLCDLWMWRSLSQCGYGMQCQLREALPWAAMWGCGGRYVSQTWTLVLLSHEIQGLFTTTGCPAWCCPHLRQYGFPCHDNWAHRHSHSFLLSRFWFITSLFSCSQSI